MTEPAKIFLTGATGFLGAFLLHDLLQQTQADIYCLVRSSNTEEGQQKIQKHLEFYGLWEESRSSRILPVSGDLSEPLLGLSAAQFAEMAELIDAIYHNGAAVNFTYPYAALKATNVLGTQEVLRFASQIRAKPLHYISTLSVFDSSAYLDVKTIREEDELAHSEGLYYGYAQSKWVAEKLVAIARSRGLPVTIYRPGTILGDSKTGVCHTDDFMCRTIKGCIQLTKAPDLDVILNMAPVDYISASVVYLSQQPESLGKVFHLLNPHELHLSQLVDWIASFGYPLEQIPYQKWQSELMSNAARSQENALFTLLPLFMEKISEEQLTLPEMYFQNRRPKIDCQNAIAALAKTSIICPPVDAELLTTYFSYFVRSGFLNSSG